MNLNELYPFAEDPRPASAWAVVPVPAWGCTSGKGNKGQNARSGGVRPAEGGQMPLQRPSAQAWFQELSSKFKVE